MKLSGWLDLFGRISLSIRLASILFEGYEKNKDDTNNSNNSNLDDLEDMSKYISPSFRIKKYNLNDSNIESLRKH